MEKHKKFKNGAVNAGFSESQVEWLADFVDWIMESENVVDWNVKETTFFNPKDDVYIDSDGEEIVIQQMQLTHLLNALAANSRVIGAKDETQEVIKRKQKEVKNMMRNVQERFKEVEEKNSIV